jgi:hypothetical protein
MSALAAHAASSAVDWVSLGPALASLLISLVTVIVTVVLWRRSRWRLAVQWRRLGGESSLDILVTVINVGGQACVVSEVGVRSTSATGTETTMSRTSYQDFREVIEASARITVELHLRGIFEQVQAYAITGSQIIGSKMTPTSESIVRLPAPKRRGFRVLPFRI